MFNPDINSPYYPYYKVHEANVDFSGYAQFPRKLCDYLLDMPDGNYTPQNNNDFPRCRLWKYLYYDCEKPLKQELPSPKQKMSVLYNPDKPTEPPTDKGYRLIPQEYIKQAQEKAQTRIYAYLGRTISSNPFQYTCSMVFDIFTHYTYELNTRDGVYSRTGAIVAALISALDGVNISGVGTFSMCRAKHPDCGTSPIFDGNTNVGTRLIIGFDMSTVENPEQNNYENMPSIEPNIRLA